MLLCFRITPDAEDLGGGEGAEAREQLGSSCRTAERAIVMEWLHLGGGCARGKNWADSGCIWEED